MKVSELFETMQSKKEINQLLKTHFRIYGEIEYHNDGSISVNGDVYVTDSSITHLPVKFRKVSGYFYCGHTNLTSLEGSPQKVGNYFDCTRTSIVNLKGGPKIVNGNFYCENTLITNLDGAPEYVGGTIYCSNTPFYERLLVDENTQIPGITYIYMVICNSINIISKF